MQSIAARSSWAPPATAAKAGGRGRRTAVRPVAASQQGKQETLVGVNFRPFEEVAPVLASTSQTEGSRDSFARSRTFQSECEAAINEQINIEYNVSYVYHAMSCYFDRDTVSLPGLAEWCRRNSVEERGHAQKLIDLQNTRGGRVKLAGIVMPETEYDHAEKGDALYAMELTLSLERLNFEKLLALWEVVDKHGDGQLTQYVEDMLDEQVADIKVVAEYVSQLRRVGKGHGVWHFDHELYEEEIRARAI